MDPKERRLRGHHYGRAWQATYVRTDRYSTSRIYVEDGPDRWTEIDNLGADTWATESELRAAIDTRVAEYRMRR